MEAIPFISSKFLLDVTIALESRGKTVHLLKQESKPIKPRKERKKYDLYESPSQGHLKMPEFIP